jgi:hypothetical protein
MRSIQGSSLAWSTYFLGISGAAAARTRDSSTRLLSEGVRHLIAYHHGFGVGGLQLHAEPVVLDGLPAVAENERHEGDDEAECG